MNEGDLHVYVPVRVNDEIGVLAQNFNRMIDSLNKAEEQLKAYAGSLEEKVTERTAELQETLAHLTETQDQLIQAEKMASLGKLTAGVAHEIKNPLNFINNFAQLLNELVEELEDEFDPKTRLPFSENAAHLRETLGFLRVNAQKIQEHGQRADAIVKNMLAHSRNQPTTRMLTNLEKLIDDYANIALQNLLTEHRGLSIQLDRHHDDQVGEIHVAPGEMSRVLLNLFDNAIYAVVQKAQQASKSYTAKIVVSTKRLAEDVEIRIEDNGMGIPESILDRIFEPFFTTKPTGSGTGLGLSLSYDIVCQGHGGSFQVESVEGEGTTFVITLPAGREEVAEQT